jgi:hypothetical protein
LNGTLIKLFGINTTKRKIIEKEDGRHLGGLKQAFQIRFKEFLSL